MSLTRWLRPPVTGAAWYDPAYRWPVSFRDPSGADPRRADYAAWYLADRFSPDVLRQPEVIAWEDLARVHTPEWLEALTHADTLRAVFALEGEEIAVDELLRTVRLAAGGTLGATRAALAGGVAAMNLLGGFHHAAPSRGVGFCAVNDLAVAAAVVRSEGFVGAVGVLDLDAHPPDGTAAALPDAWIGSISGASWGELPGVDDVVIPGAEPAAYLDALDRLLDRMPRCELVFVVSGADVLAGDRLGNLALDVAAALERDRRVLDRLRGVASVWTPAGGYHRDAWRVTAATAALVVSGKARLVPPSFEPLHARYGRIADTLPPELLGPEDDDDLLPFAPRPRARRLLGFYTAAGIELGLSRYGILEHLRRIGFGRLRLEVDDGGAGDRFRLFGTALGAEHLLIEAVLAREVLGSETFLYVHWLTLRDPRAVFDKDRPRLPGQEHPGLGLGLEAAEMMLQMSSRLRLSGVAFRPAFYHVAHASRRIFRFADDARQARFLAMLRDLGHLPLLDVTLAVSEGRATFGDAPYAWEPDLMVRRGEPVPGELAPAPERFRITP